MSVHVLDGLTSYYPTRDLTHVYARPLQYTFHKSAMNDQAALVSTQPAGILQTPKDIYEHKRLIFDFRGTPIVSIAPNEWEVKPPPKTINGPSEKNVSQPIFKPQVVVGSRHSIEVGDNTKKLLARGNAKPPVGHQQHHHHPHNPKVRQSVFKIRNMLSHEKHANQRLH